MKKFVRRPGYTPIVSRTRWHVPLDEESQFYTDSFRDLDPQVGECFALFSKPDKLEAICRVTKRYCATTHFVSGYAKIPPEQGHDVVDITVDFEQIRILKKGFERDVGILDCCRLSDYSNILQIDPRRFDVLDKQVAMLNSQLNAYMQAFQKEL